MAVASPSTLCRLAMPNVMNVFGMCVTGNTRELTKDAGCRLSQSAS
jgi:hypothetical protein